MSGIERIDELGVMQVGEAVEAEWSEIRCPNGCYEPYEVTSKHIRAAAELPRCEECDSFHVVEWDNNRDSNTGAERSEGQR